MAGASHDVPLNTPPPSPASYDSGVNEGIGAEVSHINLLNHNILTTPRSPNTLSSESSLTQSPPSYSSEVGEPQEEHNKEGEGCCQHLTPIFLVPPQCTCYVMVGGVICDYFDGGVYHSVRPV